MRQKLIYTILMAVMAMLAQAQVAFVGNQHKVMEIDPPANTGLNKIFVLHETEGVSMTYTATTQNPVTFYIDHYNKRIYNADILYLRRNGRRLCTAHRYNLG